MKFLLLFVFLIFSCGSEETTIINKSSYPDHYANFDPALKPYVFEYDQLAAERGGANSSVVTSIQIVDRVVDLGSENTAGICLVWAAQGKRVIQIRSKYWFNMTEAQRRVLIFHELGHCALNYGHRDGTFSSLGQQIKSIMNSVVLDHSTASTHWAALVNELFNPQANLSLSDSEDCRYVGEVMACETRNERTRFNGYVEEVRPVVTVEHLRHEPFISLSFELFVGWVIVTAVLFMVFVMFFAQNIIEPVFNKERSYEVSPKKDFDINTSVYHTNYKPKESLIKQSKHPF